MTLILNPMRATPVILSLLLASPAIVGQATKPAPEFEVASVRPSLHLVGPDYNNQVTYSADGIIAKNVTVKRLIADAYHLQLDQVFGPGWLGKMEYDINARTAGASTTEQMAPMLQNLLAHRFGLVAHRETRPMRVYELAVAKTGLKIHPADEGGPATAAAGFHFHGDMRAFADLLAVQFSIPAAESPSSPVRASEAQIPVIDETGLPGIYDFRVDVHPELGTDAFTLWRRALEEQLGLRIESRKGNVPVLVVDDALKTPAAN